MSAVDTLPEVVAANATPGLMTITGPLVHLCPHRDEVDRGTVTIRWRYDQKTIELHSLRAWLDGFADVKASHEAITGRIQTDLGRLDGIALDSVDTTWDTAGFDVTVTPAG